MKKLISPKSIFIFFVFYFISMVLIYIYHDQMPRKILSIINFVYTIPLLLFFIVMFIKNIKSKEDRLYTIIPLVIVCIYLICFVARMVYIYFKIWV
jgi:NADH:ubiquinone oxidoreductase subunit 6 (subunit J)